MTLSSHSPTDTPERRAASRAVSRARRLTPVTCQGTPDFMPASGCWTGRSGSRDGLRANGASYRTVNCDAPLCPRLTVFAVQGKQTVKVRDAAEATRAEV